MSNTAQVRPGAGLTAQEIQEIQQELSHYEQKSAASIEALKIVQNHRGWISDDTLKAVAGLLQMSAEELDGVATFYNLIYREPVGRKVIHYCNSVSCWMMGAERVRARMEKQLGVRLGETTADGEYTLLPIVCLGACDHAPVVMVGDRLHQDLDESGVEQMLEGE